MDCPGLCDPKTRAFAPKLAEALPRIFDLAFDAHDPIRSDSEAVIRSMGRAAVPFLLCEARSANPTRRERSLELLMHAGSWHGTTFRLADPTLEPRRTDRPDWNGHVDDVLTVFQRALLASELCVRFAGALALEEFGILLDSTVPVFIEVLQRGEPQQQMWAAVRLGRIGPSVQRACDVRLPVVAGGVNDVWTRTANAAARNALRRIDSE